MCVLDYLDYLYEVMIININTILIFINNCWKNKFNIIST